MSFADLFNSEFKSRNRGHFSAIVRVAMTDGLISPEEKIFLDRLARNLDISTDEYAEILENPTKYPVNPPYLHAHRLERLYDLARMVYLEESLGEKQEKLLSRFALALGFTPGNLSYIVAKAMSLVDKKVDSETFVYEMLYMNR